MDNGITDQWSDWLELRDAGSNKLIPSQPGLYRIRVVGAEPFAYVGQTGRSLRGRLGQLKSAFDDCMPYSDPHTAGPGLWALRQEEGVEFECSVLVKEGEIAVRKGLECLEITRHRLAQGQSPYLNFGRMPPGWRKSTGNNRRLVEQGCRRRGCRDLDVQRVPEAPPPATFTQDPLDPQLFGLMWQQFSAAVSPPSIVGVYRAIAGEDIIYFGQGDVRTRISAHARKVSTKSRQAGALSQVTRWEYVALPELAPQQLLEVENDLIAHHVQSRGFAPAAQFLG